MEAGIPDAEEVATLAKIVQEEQLEAFRTIWATKESTSLFGDFNCVVLNEAEISPAFEVFNKLMWGDDQDCNVDLALSETEFAESARLSEKFEALYHLYIGVFEKDRLIGWTWGRQESGEEFHMIVSVILPEYRGRGVYSALLPEVVKRVQAEGFQLIYSWHQSDNPAVLVPKLKAGFAISGFRMFDRYGLLVQLTYAFNPTRRELFNYRIGRAKLSERIAPMFNRGAEDFRRPPVYQEFTMPSELNSGVDPKKTGGGMKRILLVGLIGIGGLSIYRWGFFKPPAPPADGLQSGHSEIVSAILSDKLKRMPAKEAQKFVEQSLEDPNPGLREAALEERVASGKPGVMEELNHAYRDSSSEIRISALQNAIDVDRERGLRMVLIAARDEDVEVRIAAINILSSHIQRNVGVTDTHIKKHPTNPKILSSAERRYLPAVIKCLDDTNPYIRSTAVSILKHVSGEKWSYRDSDTEAQKGAIIHQWKIWWLRAEPAMKIPADFDNLAPIRPERSDSAPSFELTDFVGKPASFKSQLGKVTLINFWGTWCPPCRQELPDIQKAHETFKGTDLDIVGVAVSEPKGSWGVGDFCKKNGLTYRQALITPEVSRAFGNVDEVPMTYLLDRQCRIRYIWEGPRDFGTFSAAIDRLLHDKAGEIQKK